MLCTLACHHVCVSMFIFLGKLPFDLNDGVLTLYLYWMLSKQRISAHSYLLLISDIFCQTQTVVGESIKTSSSQGRQKKQPKSPVYRAALQMFVLVNILDCTSFVLSYYLFLALVSPQKILQEFVMFYLVF